MFWKNSSLSAKILCVIFVGFVGMVLSSVFFNHSREVLRTHANCQSNLRIMGLGFIQYAQDYEEKWPLVVSGGAIFGWADALQPYLKSTQLYQCPQEPNEGASQPFQNGYTDYAFNARLSGKSLGKISAPSRQILSLDGNDGTDQTDARYSLSQIPPEWQENANSPLYRHKAMANYLFADGHVKSLLPSHVQDANGIVF